MQVKVLFCSQATTQPGGNNNTNWQRKPIEINSRQWCQKRIYSQPCCHWNTYWNSWYVLIVLCTKQSRLKKTTKCGRCIFPSVTQKAAIAYERERLQQHFSLQLDNVQAHEAWVRSETGYCQTPFDTSIAVTEARLTRKAVCAAVLKLCLMMSCRWRAICKWVDLWTQLLCHRASNQWSWTNRQ
jgi:hypothetical protein